MPLLGASTKTYKSYGKRKVHTTNRALSWDDSPPAAAASNSKKASLNSSSSSSASSSEDSPPPLRRALGPKNISTAPRPMKGRSNEADKENAPTASPRKPVFSKAKSRLTVQRPHQSPMKPKRNGKSSTSSTESREERRPLAPKGARRSPEVVVEVVVTKRRPSPLQKALELPLKEVTTEEGSSAEEVVKPKRSRGARMVVESEEEEQDELQSTAEESQRSTRSSRNRQSTVEEEPTSGRLSTRSSARHTSREELELDEFENKVSALTLADPDPDEEEDQLDSDDEPLAVLPTLSAFPLPESLSSLISTVEQTAPYDFASFIASPPAPFSAWPSEEDSAWIKIGEASYSEVFMREGMVVKIIPVSSDSVEEADEEQEEMPYTSEADSVGREIEISKLMGEVKGFVGYFGAFLVQGRYPEALLEEWDRFKAEQPVSDSEEGEQIRPDVLPANQVFAILLLAHGGSDLETYTLCSWMEAASVVHQVGTALAEGENSGFEHRDLHWGNILLRDSTFRSSVSVLATPPRARQSASLFSSLGAESSGIEATLIDFTLSRASTDGNEVLYDGFEDDCIFEGEGDHQFEVYRMMRVALEDSKDGWATFEPRSNVMWLHYLLLKLLHCKKLRPPPPPPSAASSFASPARAQPSPFRSRTTRRTSTLLTLALTAATKAKARTMPNLASSASARRIEARERECYDLLLRLEDTLRRSLGLEEGVGREGAGGRRKVKVKAKGRGKPGRREEDEGRFGSVQEVMQWWKEGMEE